MLVGVITGSHQWTRFNMPESQFKRFLFDEVKLIGRVETRNRQVIARRPQILTNRENIHRSLGQIAKHVLEFGHIFAQADHYSTLGYYLRIEQFGIPQNAYCPLIARARPNRAIKARYSFRIVVEDVWFSFDHHSQRSFVTLEIGDQNLDPAFGSTGSDLVYGFGENLSPAQVVIVTVHAGHDCVLQTQGLHRFGDPSRFIPVDWLRLAFRHGTKAAATSANVPQQHECCRAVVPTFANIRTLCRLADRV